MKKHTLTFNCLALSLLLTGCGYSINSTPGGWLSSYGLSVPDNYRSPTLCNSFGCQKQRQVSFSADELARLEQLFRPASRNAEQERQRIAVAIGLLETISGPKLGTEQDQPQNSFSFTAPSNQLDCIAETSNTSLYLLLLQEHHLLRFHQVTGNVHRGPLTLHAPHNSAAIRERKSNKAFAVDSWFGGNGDPAWITPVENWLNGATPTDN